MEFNDYLRTHFVLYTQQRTLAMTKSIQDFCLHTSNEKYTLHWAFSSNLCSDESLELMLNLIRR
jgi:hypothetical protein